MGRLAFETVGESRQRQTRVSRVLFMTGRLLVGVADGKYAARDESFAVLWTNSRGYRLGGACSAHAGATLRHRTARLPSLRRTRAPCSWRVVSTNRRSRTMKALATSGKRAEATKVGAAMREELRAASTPRAFSTLRASSASKRRTT